MCFVIFSTFLQFFMTLKFARFCYFWFLVVFRALKFAHFWDLWFLVVFRELKFGLFLVIFAFWHGCRRKMIVLFMENCKLEEKVSQGAPLYTPSVWKPMSHNRWTVGVRSKHTYRSLSHIGGQWASGQNVLTFLFFVAPHKKHPTYIRSHLRWVEI